ncbi:RidA family protein [Kitasatospora sp. NPDC008115]|uniref:RidA family protein n=1 Tax=Kitasatospora sp. NPDC008115 TaxID=3364022 RepID=UPI0036EADA88
MDEESGEIAADVAGQTARALENVRRVVEGVGGHRARTVVQVAGLPLEARIQIDAVCTYSP